jgi:DNA-binding response OmpR family regulator
MRKKVLVVDDDPDLLDLVSFNLRKAGFWVGTADDGAQALSKVRSFSPDLMLLDVMMPELDGLEICEMLRRDPATAGIPIILLTALSSELARINGLGSGADDYVTKPFSVKDLVARVTARLQPAERSS